jgi:hypothetical protein
MVDPDDALGLAGLIRVDAVITRGIDARDNIGPAAQQSVA